jgi:hypothetical protein
MRQLEGSSVFFTISSQGLFRPPLSPHSVSAGLVRSKLTQFAQALAACLTRYPSSAHVVRFAAPCIDHVLQQVDPAGWRQPEAQSLFLSLLNFLPHDNPKARRAVHQAVKTLLAAMPEQAVRDLSVRVDAILAALFAPSAGAAVAHALPVLPPILRTLPSASVKSACAAACANLASKDPHVVHALCHSLHAIASDPPPSIPPSALLSVFNELMKHPPPSTQPAADLAREYLSALAAAMAASTLRKGVLSDKKAARFVSVISTFLLSPVDTIRDAAAGAFASAVAATADVIASEASAPALAALAQRLADVAVPQFSTAPHNVAHALSALFAALAPLRPEALSDLLKAVTLRYRAAGGGADKEAMERCVGSFLTAAGAEPFLNLFPLVSDAQPSALELMKRTWIVYLITTYARNSCLTTFVNSFAPLAATLRRLRDDAPPATAQTLGILRAAILKTFPSFTSSPRDPHMLNAAFVLFACLVEEDPPLASTLCAALRAAVEGVTDDSRQSVVSVLKTQLPRLLTLYPTLPADDRPSALAALNAAFPILPANAVNAAFSKIGGKLLEAGADGAARVAVMDLLLTLTPSLDATNADRLARLVGPNVLAQDPPLQKKAYKILAAVAAHQPDVFLAIGGDVMRALEEALPVVASAARGARVKLLSALLSKNFNDGSAAFLAEIILATKDKSKKARDGAYDALVNVARGTLAGGGEATEAFGRFVLMLMAGFGGKTSVMISGAVLAVARVLFEFPKQMVVKSRLALTNKGLVAVRPHPCRNVSPRAPGAGSC